MQNNASYVAPWLDDGDVRLYHGDCRSVLAQIEQGSAQTCVTSPPYWGLRDYGVDGQAGLEETLPEFIDGMVDVFRGVRDVLAADGTLWVNMGDSYVSAGGPSWGGSFAAERRGWDGGVPKREPSPGLKPKDLTGQAWRLAIALQADGWYLRQCIVWHKPNAMPESVKDRPHTAHEYVFLLAKSERYFYDGEAVREPLADATLGRRWSQAPRTANPDEGLVKSKAWGRGKQQRYVAVDGEGNPLGRNKRSVWTVPTEAFPGAHFATFPPALIEPCILAGSRPGDVVLDPFMGSGTTAWVARHHSRRAVGVELNEKYLNMAAERLGQQSLLAVSHAQ
jgi:site-specific DNA-methyltransferase (cytosine-N4-specific)